jgi:hypothetical protein
VQPELLAQLSVERAKLPPPKPAAPRNLDAQTLERLRALGYAE